MKTVLKILAVLVLLAIVAIGAALHFTRGIVDTADAFFQAVREGRTADATSQLSEGFRAATDAQALMRFLDDSQIRRVESANWHSRSVSGGEGRLEGSLTTEGGGRVPIVIDLVKERGAWKIHRIERAAAGLAERPVRPELPATEEAQALAQQTTRDFVTSLANGSMAHFHASVSRLWQSQYSVAELDQAYRVFLDLDADLGVLNSLEPQFASTPDLDDDGVLSLEGHYATEPSRVRFSYRYVVEGSTWKPLGLDMKIGGD